MVLWELVTLAQQPYQGMSNEEVLNFVKNGNTEKVPSGTPEIIANLMRDCWRFEASDRPTFIGNFCQFCSSGFCGAGLCGVGLCGAGLCGAGLYGAGLCGAGLCGAGHFEENSNNYVLFLQTFVIVYSSTLTKNSNVILSSLLPYVGVSCSSARAF